MMQGALQVLCWLLFSIRVVQMVPDECMVEEGCTSALGGSSVIMFCDAEDRHQSSSNIDWFHNGEEVNAPSDRYSLSPNDERLTINPVFGTDEGQYICSYVQTSGITTNSSAGCLIVYGKGYYETCSPQDQPCIDRIMVSSDGTIFFNLNIAFYETGCSGHRQTASQTVVKKGTQDVYSCNSIVCTDGVNRWWTVNKTGLINLELTLHQALSSDRAQYQVQTELDDPITGSSIASITKEIQVTAPPCPPPPQVNRADMSTLETGSVFIVGSQVNYTCSEGCTLEGNYSLRCGIQDSQARWPDSPTCSCRGTTASDRPPSPTSIAVLPPSTMVMTSSPITKFSGDNNGSTAAVAVSVSLAVLLLVTIITVAIVVGLLLQQGRRNRRDQKTVTVGSEYVTNVPLRTNGYSTHDGIDRDSYLEDGVRLGSGDESETEGTKNSQAVDI